MATLTTSFQKVCEVSTKLSSNLTGYTRLYMKYGNRSGLNDTIYYEIRQFAYNPYGTYFAWQWDTALAWSIKSGNTTKASGSFVQSAIYSSSTDSTSNEVVRASGSYVQAHNADGTFSDTLTLSAPIYNTIYSKSGDIILPNIAINPTLTITSVSNMTASGSSVNFTLGSTNGRSTKIQYSIKGTTWVDWKTKNADGTYTETLPNLLSSYKDSYTNTIFFRAFITSGSYSSGSKSKQFSIDSSIKVSISSVTISANNGNYSSALGNLFVQNITTPTITTSASAGTGATISSYDLTALGGVSNFTTKTNIGTPYTYTAKFNQKGDSLTATVKVTDSRGSASAASKPSSAYKVIEYFTPSITSFKVQRCTSNGTLSDTGTYCKLSVTYKIAPITSGSTSYNTKSLKYKIGGDSWTTISISSYNTTITQVIGGSLSTNNSYQISVQLQDLTTTVTQVVTLPTSFVLVSKRNGGKGITFGAIAENDDLHNYLKTHIHNNLYLDSASIITAELPSNYTVTSSDYERLTLSSAVNIGGNLEISNGGIKCKKEGYVKVSAKLSFNSCSTGLKWLNITRDDANAFSMPFNTSTTRISLSIPPAVIWVTANQTFYMRVLGTNGDIVRGGRQYTEMTIEYIPYS